MNSIGIEQNRLKTLVAVWLAVLLSLLAACDQTTPSLPKTEAVETRAVSPTPNSRPSPSPTSQTVEAPTQPASLDISIDPARLGSITLNFWHIWNGAAGDTLSRLVDEFNTTNEWGITVKAEYQGTLDQMDAGVSAAFSNSSPPDIVTGYSYQALAWNELQALVDLRPYIDDPQWGLTPKEQESFYPAFWEQDISGEKRLGFPALRSGQLLYYNETWARELGFTTPPTTPEQFKQQACAAAQSNNQDDQQTNDGSGGYILSTNYSAVSGWIAAFGGEITRLDGSGYRFDQDQAEEAFTFLRDLYDQGCAWLAESDLPESEFANRMGLFISGSVMNLPYQTRAFRLASRDDQWTVIPFPSPANQPVISVYGPSFQVVSSTPEEQLAAWLFVKWLTAPQNQARLVQATGSFPLSASSVDFLEEYRRSHPQWGAALDLLPSARPEPGLQSWNVVRWALSDAATQLFRYYFTIDQVPNLVKLLDETAADLHSGAR